ncbi:MAG: hypothetical protein ABFR19_02275 [Pseudomonadota bacterium]
MALTLLFIVTPALADDSKELRKQQQAAQKERQAQKNDRNKGINGARKELRATIRDMKLGYQEQLKDLDTEFELRRVELRADHDARVATAEAENQQKISSLFMKSGFAFDDESVEQLQAEGRAYSEALFALKKQSAEELHQEQVANTERKHALLQERDQGILDKASALGLTADYPPILATPIGDTLTSQEEKWNEKERREVQKLKERNAKTLSEFRNGETVRKWEIAVLQEDFKLTWDEKSELHALDSQQTLLNTLLMQPSAGGEADPQAFMTKITEINKEKTLINIKYKKIRDQNRIKRRKEKKAILAGS